MRASPTTVALEDYVQLEMDYEALQETVELVTKDWELATERAENLENELVTAKLNSFYYENLYYRYKEFYFKIIDAYQAVPQDPRRKSAILEALLNVIDEAHMTVYGED